MDIVRIILAIILPPVGVFLQVGIGMHFWINIVLTLLGYVPGIVHAIYIIVKNRYQTLSYQPLLFPPGWHVIVLGTMRLK